MNLKTTARKIAVTTIVGAVVAVGGTAFAEIANDEPDVIEESTDEVVEAPVQEGPEGEVDGDIPVTDVAEPDPDAVITPDPDDEAEVTPVPEPLEAVDDLADDAEEVLEDVDADVVEEAAEEVVAEDVEPVVAAHPANHGAAVSEAAHAPTPEGARNHGEAVSEVARSDAGKPEGHGNQGRSGK